MRRHALLLFANPHEGQIHESHHVFCVDLGAHYFTNNHFS